MIRFRHVLMVGALLALSTASAQAGFSGSLGVNGDNVEGNPSPNNIFSNSSFTTFSNTVLTDGTDGFLGSISAVFTGTTIDLSDAANGFGFRMTNDDWGTFTATHGSWALDGRPGVPSFTLFVTGDYTGSTTNNLNPTYGVVSTFSAYITLTQIGGSLTQQIVLEVPAIPEPSSVALGAIGLVSMGLVALRKRRASK